MTKMKKLLSIALASVMSISLMAPAMAAVPDLNTSIDIDVCELTTEEIAANLAHNQRLLEAAERVASTRGRVDLITYSAPATLCQQQNTYYCGPASAKMVYEGITGDTSHNQDWFANKLGTTTDGSSSSQIAAF